MEGIHRSYSSTSNLSQVPSSQGSGRGIPKSSSIRSLIDFTKHKNSRSTDAETNASKKSSESGGPRSMDIPALRASSEATTDSINSSSPVKVTFEVPNFTVTDTDSPSEDSGKTVAKKPSFFSSFANFLDSNSEHQGMKRSSSSQSLNPQTTQPSNPPMLLAPAPVLEQGAPLPPPQARRHRSPLFNLKKKTVSRLFFNDTETDPKQDFKIEPSSPASANNSQNSLPVSPHSMHLEEPPANLPFPLIRSFSSQADTTMKPLDLDDSDKAAENLVTRPRSRTLSIDRKTPGSISGFFSRRSESDHPPTNNNSLQALSTTARASSPCLTVQEVSLPDREDDETPAHFLSRVRKLGIGANTAGELSKHDTVFHREVLQLYLELFNFTNDPIDICLRVFLLAVCLPKETQQIDRILEAFAFRYHQCNPTIYSTAENAYFIVFSLMILHTDFFNKNNKFKMQKSDYFKITEQTGISNVILGVSNRSF